MIHVLAYITAKPGQREALLKEFRALLPAVRAEQGCIEYGPAVDADMGGFQTKVGADGFVVVEKWESLDMLKAHAERAPLKRNVDPGEVGATAAFLLSEAGSGITGETIFVDCGYNIMGF